MKKGFTLIELLVVITIIGILAVVLIPSFLNAPAKARDLQRKTDVITIIKALQAARADGISLSMSPYYLCADNSTLGSFLKYFPNGEVPTDPNGSNIANCTLGKYFIFNPQPLPSTNSLRPDATNVLALVATKVELPEVNGNTSKCSYPSADINVHIAYNVLSSASPSDSSTLCYYATQSK